jgi:hypothetical protein
MQSLIVSAFDINMKENLLWRLNAVMYTLPDWDIRDGLRFEK